MRSYWKASATGRKLHLVATTPAWYPASARCNSTINLFESNPHNNKRYCLKCLKWGKNNG